MRQLDANVKKKHKKEEGHANLETIELTEKHPPEKKMMKPR